MTAKRKPGRPREHDNRSATSIRLPVELHDQLTQAAHDRDLSVNFLVTRAVADFLERLIPVDEWKLTR